MPTARAAIALVSQAMKKNLTNRETPITIANLYPHLSDEQLLKAEENLNRYIQLALQIYERIQQDPHLYAKFRHLTAKNHDTSMHGEPSGSS